MKISFLSFRSRRTRKTGRNNKKRYPARVKPYEIPAQKTRYLNETVDKGYIAAKVLNLMETRRLYMNPKLREEELMKAVGTNRNYLSRAINDTFLFGFNNLCNYFRIKEACAVYLSSPKITREKWMKKSGFNSSSSFTKAFIAFTDYTPSKWQKEVHLRLKRKEIVSVSDYVKELNII